MCGRHGGFLVRLYRGRGFGRAVLPSVARVAVLARVARVAVDALVASALAV